VAAKIAAAAMLAAAIGCSHAVYHRVRSGETVYRISKAYGVSVKQLAGANHLSDPSRIEVGQRLLIPGARRQLPVDLITPRTASSRPLQHEELPRGGETLKWPVSGGTVTSGFGQRNHSFHDGIDISAPIGTPVHVADDGEVIYSDVLRGYGNVIIVRHTHGLATVYAHNQSNRVHEGQRVRCGEVIGNVGESGRTTGANLHFEVRKDNVARDPIFFLPAVEQVAAPKPAARHGS
jgi:murein DD-endopeptidase MepM/ murein hydrolase activator NlpD